MPRIDVNPLRFYQFVFELLGQIVEREIANLRKDNFTFDDVQISTFRVRIETDALNDL